MKLNTSFGRRSILGMYIVLKTTNYCFLKLIIGGASIWRLSQRTEHLIRRVGVHFVPTTYLYPMVWLNVCSIKVFCFLSFSPARALPLHWTVLWVKKRIHITEVGPSGAATNMSSVLFRWVWVVVGGVIDRIILERTVKLLLWLLPVWHWIPFFLTASSSP